MMETQVATATRRTPIDVDTIEKGDFIPPESFMAIMAPIEPSDKEWGLKMIKHRDRLADQLCAKFGGEPTIRIEGGGLRILTDVEASSYNADDIKRSVRKMGRANTRMHGVSVAAMSAEERRQHERRMLGSAFVYGAARDALNSESAKPLRLSSKKKAAGEVVNQD